MGVKPSVVAGVRCWGRRVVGLNNGSGFTQQAWPVQNTWGSSGYTVAGDFNGDGRTDIASANGGTIFVKQSTGSGFTNLAYSVSNTWGGDGWTYAGDFNQDGYSDIASPNGGSLYLKLGSPSGFNSTTWSISNVWGSRYYTRAGDFNADGRTDLASANGDKVHLKLNTGSGFTDLTWPVNNTWGGNDWLFVGDFNNDGSTDLASPNGANVIMKLRGEEQYCTVVNVNHYSGFVQCAFEYTGTGSSFWVQDSTNPWVPGAYGINVYGQREWCRALHPSDSTFPPWRTSSCERRRRWIPH